MSTITDYKIVGKVYESANSLIYRALPNTGDRCVILKVLKKDYPNPSELTRYKQEYQITRSLNIKGAIAAYDLFPYENSLAIILEDFGGQSLDTLLKSRLFTLLEFLQIALQIAEALEGIHEANIIHKDINPSNIIYNLETGQVKIIDFGISSIFTKETPALKNPNILEGTLTYMSPEQTGRMNRALDYRTDFYSLGATFYTLLTGRLVFEGHDALELVHCHIACKPIPPHEINPSIPKIISEIVMKLLAKTAEERYQTGLGLKADLNECYKQLQQTGQIAQFPLAGRDFAKQLQIPQKLYGRESEIEQLLEIFNRVTAEKDSPDTIGTIAQKRAEMMLVGGFSGIGKTALIQELYRPISQKRGYFIAGKFDQFQRNIPYSAVISALQSLIRQLLTENQTQLNEWRDKLNEALGVNGQLIVDVIPIIEQIIGKQPPVQPLETTQAQNRFNRVFQSFIRIFCQQSHPLVIFLDDLQWADFGTLKLIELMMSNLHTEYLLLLGAYRDNEVDANHPTILTIERLKEQGETVNKINLTPLDIEDITQLLIDTLHRDRKAVNSLAELILQKTSGNPFFINEFLKTIDQENLFTFNYDRQFWEWEVAQIAALDITDNVVDLMLGKLQKMPNTTQNALSFAACIGNHFDLNTLSIICEQSESDTFQKLLPAIQDGFIQPLSELEITSEAPLESTLILRNYKFRHDRIQQAAYIIIRSEMRNFIHFQIGHLLLTNLSKQEKLEKIFTLVDHLNKGVEFIEDRTEKIKLLELNLYAGKKAKEALAYATSKKYLLRAKDEFPGEIWKDNYDMAIELHKELAEIEYLNGNISQSQYLIESSLKQIESVLDSVEFYYLQIVQYTLLGLPNEAVKSGRTILKLLGDDLPEENFQLAFEKSVKEYQENLGNRKIRELYDNPVMELAEKKAALKILSRIFASAWYINIFLVGIVGIKTVTLNIKYGHTYGSPVGYAFMAFVVTHMIGDYHAGYEYGCLSLKLSDQDKDFSSKVVAAQFHGNYILPWLEHIKLSERVNTDGIEAGLQVGDLQVVGYIYFYNLYNLIYQQKNLDLIVKEVSRNLSFIQDTKLYFLTNFFLAAKICLDNITGLTEKSSSFNIDEIEETKFLKDCQNNLALSGALCCYLIFKIQVLYLYDRPIEVQYLKQAQDLLVFIPGTISIAKHNFYYSLTLIARYPEASPEEQKEYWQQIETNQKEMKGWADNCEANFLHKYLLVAAEMTRISGKWQEAMELYDRAIASAKEHEFIQNEALGNELAAKFWLAQGKQDFAKLYMRRARQGYQIWGAKRKVEDLEEKYPQWFTSQSSDIADITKLSITTTSGQSTKSLDIDTVIKAAETLSKEIVLKNLLAKLMQIAIENAGAQKGYLILVNNNKLTIEAAREVGKNEVTVLQSQSVETTDLLPQGIINYAMRTQEDLVLSNATHQGLFINEPYIVENQPKSVLCAPIINQGKLIGLLYLENNLTTDAFTTDRLELLRVLSAQAAISIENALLYQTLEQKVEERTAQLAQANTEIVKLNERLKEDNLRMSAELDITRELQQMILPKTSELQQIPGLDIAGFMEPATEVGGDYYDVLNQDGRVKIGIGDVTGHGLESGVVMIMAQTAVRALLANNETDPVRFLSAVNQTIYGNVQRMNAEKMLSLALLDYQDGTVRISGQHEEVILIRADGSLELIDTMELGFPIGLESDVADFISELEIVLNPGDGIVLYTDGITEAENPEKELYGLERLCDVVRQNYNLSATEMQQNIIADVRRYIGTQEVFDDITLVVLKQK